MASRHRSVAAEHHGRGGPRDARQSGKAVDQFGKRFRILDPHREVGVHRAGHRIIMDDLRPVPESRNDRMAGPLAEHERDDRAEPVLMAFPDDGTVAEDNLVALKPRDARLDRGAR